MPRFEAIYPQLDSCCCPGKSSSHLVFSLSAGSTIVFLPLLPLLVWLGTTWVRSRIELVPNNSRPCYVICDNCGKSLDAKTNTRTYCNACNEWMITDLRT